MLRLPEFPPHVALIVVDCRNFHGTFNGHVGLHYGVQREYLEDRRGVNKFVGNLIDQGVDPVMLGDRSEKHIVAFYCNAGEHRSVAFAAMFGYYADMAGCDVDVKHVCKALWSRRSCGQCRQCTTVPHTDILEWLQEYFDTRRREEQARKRTRWHSRQA